MNPRTTVDEGRRPVPGRRPGRPGGVCHTHPRLASAALAACILVTAGCAAVSGTTTVGSASVAGGHRPGGSGAAPTGAAQPASVSPTPAVVPVRAPLASAVTPALPGEGVWTPAVTVAGNPIVQVTQVRPDAAHAMASVAWIDGAATRFVLHPGSQDPVGGPFSQPTALPIDQRAGLIATFNGGFKVKDSRGGYYEDGRTVGALVPGAASEIFHADGRFTVGAWGRDATLTPDVVGVRQNLQLMVDGGRLNPAVYGDVEGVWGATLQNAVHTWRTGVGVTSDGNLVYVAGPALSPVTLAQLLLRAGAVSAMELDINPAWTSFMYYTPSPTGPLPQKLLPFYRPVDRYYQGSTRDFTAVYAR